MRELRDPAAVAAAAGGDELIVWAAQGLRPGVRAWAAGDAVAVACPELSRRDRLAVAGGARAAAGLLRAVLPEVGPRFRPVGDEALLRRLADVVPGLAFAAAFGWMSTAEPVPPAPGVAWLDPADDPEVAALLETAAPDSYARPGGAGVRRWAGLRGGDGGLRAVAADAWSAPEVGFLAGVATDPAARGRGLARAVCAFVTAELLAAHPRVALMVDHDNPAAAAVYTALGFRPRRIAAAWFAG
ncbi:GNAT family N-acetyltransferase [Spirilliplanes yamanashiensis]|uniref:N-acetyltransferase domain-containing protein n=1 Tax=Spirilliplanes yamanashiensis TaxID=42233 RepID=A0A8J3YAG4_9ACTN|nr:GNAT family N-acetyltransferase [Spirilliplanes yamanashiensis]MDP9818575.1 GNAT superfamily N-acetyltransferase [Spirilliplanes yamanashiensis]GIJ05031.1 hypothetical protein Sya03_43830 [Spirilliplanes yamanashiensis]